MTYPDVVALAVPGFIALMLAEMVAIRLGAHGDYDWRDTATSLALGFGSTIAGALVGVAVFAVDGALYSHRLFDVPETWWTVAIAFVLYDFAYYWFHRTAHTVRWFWAGHIVHHSSQHYNLSTALRQTWTGFIALSLIFYLPLFWLGFPPAMIAFVGGANLVYQFWIHTEVVQRLPLGLEWVLNTPSHHRVHHGTNPRYLDRNYAGVFIVWDRMFGTFEPEDAAEPVRYGLVHNLATFNPVRAAFGEWVSIFRDLRAARSWRARWAAVAGPPGWSSGDTAQAIRSRWEVERESQTERKSIAGVFAE